MVRSLLRSHNGTQIFCKYTVIQMGSNVMTKGNYRIDNGMYAGASRAVFVVCALIKTVVIVPVDLKFISISTQL